MSQCLKIGRENEQIQSLRSYERTDAVIYSWEFPQGSVSPTLELSIPIGFEVGRQSYPEKTQAIRSPAQEFCIPAPKSYYNSVISIYDTAMEVAGEASIIYKSNKNVQHKSWVDDPRMDAFLLISHLSSNPSKISEERSDNNSFNNVFADHEQDAWIADAKMLWMLDTGYLSLKKDQKYDENKKFGEHNDIVSKSASKSSANLFPPPRFLEMNSACPKPSSSTFSSTKDAKIGFQKNPAAATQKHTSTNEYNQMVGFHGQQFNYQSLTHVNLQPPFYRNFRSQKQHDDFQLQNRSYRPPFHRGARPDVRDDFFSPGQQTGFPPQNYRDFRQQSNFNSNSHRYHGHFFPSDYSQQNGISFRLRHN